MPGTSSVSSPRKKHTATVFFMHGLGDSGAGWAPVTEELRTLLPHVKFVLPNAPARPVTLNFGMSMPAWYDIHSLADMDQDEDEAGMLASSLKISHMIRDEVHAGIPSNRIVVGGFSQGGAMSLLCGLSSEHKLAGIVNLSGYLPLRTKIFAMASEANKKTPLLMAHGDADEVVAYKFSTLSAQTLQKAGYPVTFKAYGGMGHATCPQEIGDLLRFLNEVIPDQPE
ncbi:Phospholipase/carboxylesterase/thioesterase [Thamnocephalis sphaerospora]|uniref:Acyl-protein thioesterase 1 n=1 Tax=Thamnocephalis sphaerospora TaxID=78915 RepID=A0A4P9XXV4_9FUNG|nr:Phospholipase/carboxylesterase/thioesterase [Thamnocephalis sphaerospora]|eukprot:RKP11177.1 Phospholipase/carboxylesterase/thioesterase [Thamnocephalis sphaerospora]